jgi:two-component system, NtrC family, sensor kinase
VQRLEESDLKREAAYREMQESNKLASIGRLAAGVAHEINNPLTGILFYATLKMEALTPDDPERADVQDLIEDVKRCKDIVQNLLAYSRQTNPMKNIIELNDAVNQSMSLIRDPKMFLNVQVERQFSDEMMLLHVDKNQISQVIINLVINAVSAMNRSGVLTLKTYRDKSAGKAYLEVTDTGCGIAPEHISKIFDPFFTTKATGEGTGLGLSTAYGLVQENKGGIRVKETGSNGTTFLLEFELYQPLQESQPQ